MGAAGAGAGATRAKTGAVGAGTAAGAGAARAGAGANATTPTPVLQRTKPKQSERFEQRPNPQPVSQKKTEPPIQIYKPSKPQQEKSRELPDSRKQVPRPNQKKSLSWVAVIFVVATIAFPIFRTFAAFDQPSYNTTSTTINSYSDSGSASSYTQDYPTTEISNPTILASNDDIEIIVSAGDGVLRSYNNYDYYYIPASVLNKTNTNVDLYIDDVTANDPSGKSLPNEDIFCYFMPDYRSEDFTEPTVSFAPQKTTKGWLIVDGYSSDNPLSNFKGTLIIYEVENYETLATITVELPLL
jgi:hypothetical protein